MWTCAKVSTTVASPIEKRRCCAGTTSVTCVYAAADPSKGARSPLTDVISPRRQLHHSLASRGRPEASDDQQSTSGAAWAEAPVAPSRKARSKSEWPGIVISMENMAKQLAKLRDDADDCTLISRLATEPEKRELFARLAAHLNRLAADVDQSMRPSRSSDH